MLKNQRPTNDEIKEALTECAGNVLLTSKMLGVSKTWLYKKINSMQVLLDHLKVLRYEIVDEAEIALRNRIRNGDTTAIIYTLKTMGKERGWGQKTWE
nr:MAG TPA: putative terminase small subunit [Bacteriophage sp.]